MHCNIHLSFVDLQNFDSNDKLRVKLMKLLFGRGTLNFFFQACAARIFKLGSLCEDKLPWKYGLVWISSKSRAWKVVFYKIITSEVESCHIFWKWFQSVLEESVTIFLSNEGLVPQLCSCERQERHEKASWGKGRISSYILPFQVSAPGAVISGTPLVAHFLVIHRYLADW